MHPADWSRTFSAGDGPWGVWEILWKAGAGEGPLQRRTFEASTATRTFLHKWVENWQQGGGSESGIRSPVAAPGVHGAPGAAVGGEAAAADLRAALEAVAAEGTLQQGRQDADDPGEAGSVRVTGLVFWHKKQVGCLEWVGSSTFLALVHWNTKVDRFLVQSIWSGYDGFVNLSTAI